MLAAYGVFPVDTPPDRHAAVADAVARANRGLAVGNFEFDPEDGELLFKTALPLGDDPPNADVVRALLHANIDTLDRFFPDFAALLYG